MQVYSILHSSLVGRGVELEAREAVAAIVDTAPRGPQL